MKIPLKSKKDFFKRRLFIVHVSILHNVVYLENILLNVARLLDYFVNISYREKDSYINSHWYKSLYTNYIKVIKYSICDLSNVSSA